MGNIKQEKLGNIKQEKQTQPTVHFKLATLSPNRAQQKATGARPIQENVGNHCSSRMTSRAKGPVTMQHKTRAEVTK
jgi:hypothetical protein